MKLKKWIHSRLRVWYLDDMEERLKKEAISAAILHIQQMNIDARLYNMQDIVMDTKEEYIPAVNIQLAKTQAKLEVLQRQVDCLQRQIIKIKTDGEK